MGTESSRQTVAAEAFRTTQTIVKIVFPIGVILLLAAVVWFVVRAARWRKATQVSD